MDPNKRKPVPAGGQPTQATIAAAETTPAAGDTAAPATEAAQPTDEDGAVEARVLVAFGDYQPDDIVTGSARAIDQLEIDGVADPHPDAVAFARSLQA